jgi:hypothetical protein
MTRAPDAALEDLLKQVPDLDRASQSAQFHELLLANAFSIPVGSPPFTSALFNVTGERWAAWAAQHGVISKASYSQVTKAMSEGVCPSFRVHE